MEIELVECPRDAMQGIKSFIPTEAKISYLNALLRVGFSTLDFGSFVSPKAIPQLQDTAQVLKGLDLSETKTKLLAIIANPRGAEEAAVFEEITYLGYPFSLSETFQQRNTNRNQKAAAEDVIRIQEICEKNKKKLVLYFSMGFGNPYGDPYDEASVEEWLLYFQKYHIKIFSLADTVGTADAETISRIFKYTLEAYPQLTIGAHFHAKAEERKVKLKAAYEAGCRRFDSAMLGFGGCPMAEDELVGNISTEALISFLDESGEKISIDREAFKEARVMASELFGMYH
jgi:hydroxymethylglutaryl-CoA lyase